MADATLEAALQQLLAQRNQIDQAITALQQVMSGEVPAAGSTPPQATSTTPSTRPSSTAPRGGEVAVYPGEFFDLSLTKAAEKILRRAGRPLKTTEIVAAFRRAQFPIKGKQPESNLYTSLKRSKDFVKVLPNTWALAEWHPDAVAVEPKPRKSKRRKARRQKQQPTETAENLGGAVKKGPGRPPKNASASVIERVVEVVRDTATVAHPPGKVN